MSDNRTMFNMLTTSYVFTIRYKKLCQYRNYDTRIQSAVYCQHHTSFADCAAIESEYWISAWNVSEEYKGDKKDNVRPILTENYSYIFILNEIQLVQTLRVLYM